VTVQGGQIGDVRVDDAWAARVNRQHLSDALLQAFQDARRRSAEARPAPGDDRTRQAAGELREVLDVLGFGTARPGGGED
jgi:hypothetical protein